MSKFIDLTQDKQAIIDDEDFEKVNKFKWYASFDKKMNQFYAHRSVLKNRSMHRFIMNITDKSILVDHIDGNTLNNQKSNLRVSNYTQNGQNRTRVAKNNKSGYRGVAYRKDMNKWRSYIYLQKKQVTIGYFNTPEEAAKAFDKAAKQHYGEFCGKLNFKYE